MPPTVRHVTPIAPHRARDLVAEVYAQVDAEFSSIGPAILMTSPSPEILAAGWSLLRESQLTGAAPLTEKTLAALGVSQANGCAYDALSYLAALRLMGASATADELTERGSAADRPGRDGAWPGPGGDTESGGAAEPGPDGSAAPGGTGAEFSGGAEPGGGAALGGGAESGRVPSDPRLARLLGWARATASGAAGEMPPVGATSEEFLGTVLFTHFVNRMVLAMLPPDLAPGDLTADAPAPFEGAPVLRVRAPGREADGLGGAADGTPERHPAPVPGGLGGTEGVAPEQPPGRGPGASLGLLGGHPRGARPAWSDGPVGTAYGVLAATAAQGAGLLSPAANAVVAEVVAANRGRIAHGRPRGVERLDALGEADRAGARVAIRTALAPARLTDADVTAWRATDRRLSDHCTVFLLAYGAMSAVRHIEADLARTLTP